MRTVLEIGSYALVGAAFGGIMGYLYGHAAGFSKAFKHHTRMMEIMSEQRRKANE